jgi:hypothetical protein
MRNLVSLADSQDPETKTLEDCSSTRLEADNAQAAAKIRQLGNEKDQSLVRIQALEIQIGV